MILAHDERSVIEQVIATDPFVTHSAARYRVTEFLPTMTGSLLAPFREP